VKDCDAEPHEARLRSLDPANGVGWFGVLQRASDAHDDEVLDVAVEAIGRTERVDTYWTTLSARLSTALAGSHDVALSEALITVIGTEAAMPIPAYSAASRACRGERLERPGAMEACRAMAASFERGDSYLTEMIGTGILKRLWPEDSPEWAAASRARRVGHYRLKMQSNDAAPFWDAAAAGRFVRHLAESRREQDFVAAELSARGIPPDPPPGWLDDSPN